MVAYDFGIKTTILRHLARIATVDVVPASTPAEDVLARNPDGVFLSNGPGDPAAVGYASDAIQGLLGQVPVFGICLGHQLLATALGGETYKLPFGHHGGNHPVRRLATDAIEITSQNHNYAVAEGTIPTAEVTHVNLNDGVIEGIRALADTGLQRPVPPRGRPRPPRRPLPLRPLRRAHGPAQADEPFSSRSVGETRPSWPEITHRTVSWGDTCLGGPTSRRSC